MKTESITSLAGVVLRRFVLRFWPLGVRVLAKAGWSIFAARRKKHWWKAPWMTSAAGGTHPYWDAVLIFKQNNPLSRRQRDNS